MGKFSPNFPVYVTVSLGYSEQLTRIDKAATEAVPAVQHIKIAEATQFGASGK